MSLAPLVRRSTALTCLYYLLDDALSGLKQWLGLLDTDSGARHASLDVAQSMAYIERVHAEYLAYAGRSRLHGRIAEIGPGDSFGVALFFLRDGATEIQALDRFRPRRDPGRHAAIYQALTERYGLERFFDGPAREDTLKGVVYRPGCAAETFFLDCGIAFDAILSRAVFEHLYDPIAALDSMLPALTRQGLLVHRIDLRDHGMFAGHHPLTFLTIGEGLYRRMTRRSGRPNRVLLPAYRDWLRRQEVAGDIRITRLVGVAEDFSPSSWPDIDAERRRTALSAVAAIRYRLAAPFRDMTDEDLAVAGIVLRAGALEA